MPGRGLLLLLCCLCAGIASAAPQGSVVRLAGSTSILSSGLYGLLQQRFFADTGYTIDFQSVGSGHALKLGKLGKVDVLLVHSPEAEAAFVAQGHGLARLPVMHNEFVIVGPVDDPARLGQADDAVRAFQQIAGSGQSFLSRADDSGTHRREMALWQAAGIDPYGSPWYRETGKPMSRTLTDSDQLRAYTLTDRGTWLEMSDGLSLKSLVEGDPRLHNPYSVIAVNPDRHPGVDQRAATVFIEWIRSAGVQRLIDGYRKHGEQFFTPDALE